MAKVAFSKLGLTKNTDVREITWNNQTIEVKQYLPINEKLILCANVLNDVVDDQGYYNSGKIEIFHLIEIIVNYTNVTLTEKQKEDPGKLYDLLSNGFAQAVLSVIPEAEIRMTTKIISETIQAIYQYKNSAYGILDAISTDYSDLNFDASKIQEKLANSENVEFLKQVMDKLG